MSKQKKTNLSRKDKEALLFKMVDNIDDWDLETLINFAKITLQDNISDLNDFQLNRKLRDAGYKEPL